MKSIVFSKYGTTEDLAYEDVDQPVPKDGEVLVRIHASSVKLQIMPHEANKDLARLGDMFERNELEVVIDGTYPLEQVPQALEHFGSGMANGKIVIEVRA